MSDFLNLAASLKDISSTILLVAAAIWLMAKYLPGQMRQQGEVAELLRDASAALERCSQVLNSVSSKDEEIKQSLQRIEEDLSMNTRDVRYIKLLIDQKRKD
ncbi:MAG: hypothetical protein ACI36Y_05675 [Coriobacteriales bacterium]